MNKAELENKIMESIKAKIVAMDKYDADRKAEYDDYMAQAAATDSEFWKKDHIHSAEWSLSFQHHGYEFIEEWCNVISKAIYDGREYHQWHSACAGRYKGTGHGSYVTTELNKEERETIGKIWHNMVAKGYFKVSKSGCKAKFIK